MAEELNVLNNTNPVNPETPKEQERINVSNIPPKSIGERELENIIVTESSTTTFTNKTLTAPIISTISNTGTLTLPTSTDTLVGKATTDTLTNKTLTSPTINAATLTGTIAFGDNAPNINPKARAYSSAAQDNLTDSTFTQVVLGTENYDVGGDFASNAFTAPVTGYYLITAGVGYTNIIVDKQYFATIYVNDAVWATVTKEPALATDMVVGVSDIALVTSGQTIKLYARANAGASTVDLLTGSNNTWMAVHLLSV